MSDATPLDGTLTLRATSAEVARQLAEVLNEYEPSSAPWDAAGAVSYALGYTYEMLHGRDREAGR